MSFDIQMGMMVLSFVTPPILRLQHLLRLERMIIAATLCILVYAKGSTSKLQQSETHEQKYAVLLFRWQILPRRPLSWFGH